MAREWGMQPTEFRSLSPYEFFLEFDTKNEQSKKVKDRGKGSSESWAETLKRHKAKLANSNH